MPTTLTAIPPSHQAVPRPSDGSDTPEVPEYAFSELWQNKKEGLTFGDLLDIVNPLQHIPVVSAIYRMMTGDEIGIGSRLAGGALFGGPLGALAAGAIAIFENVSGQSIEQHVAALIDGGTGDEPAVQTAARPAAGPARAAAADDPPNNAATASARPGQIRAAPAASAPAPSDRAAATDGPTTAPSSDAAAERQRIAQAIEKAQRAQAGLLLANIEADRAATQPPDKDRDPSLTGAVAGPERVQPFRAHPHMLPPGAPPHLISRAMEQALDRYQLLLQQRNAAARPGPAPVR